MDVPGEREDVQPVLLRQALPLEVLVGIQLHQSVLCVNVRYVQGLGLLQVGEGLRVLSGLGRVAAVSVIL